MRLPTAELVSKLFLAICCSFPLPFSVGPTILHSLSLEHSSQQCPLTFEGSSLAPQVQAFTCEEEEGPDLEDLEPEDLVPFLELLFFLLVTI
jgi:hypothetical protein